MCNSFSLQPFFRVQNQFSDSLRLISFNSPSSPTHFTNKFFYTTRILVAKKTSACYRTTNQGTYTRGPFLRIVLYTFISTTNQHFHPFSLLPFYVSIAAAARAPLIAHDQLLHGILHLRRPPYTLYNCKRFSSIFIIIKLPSPREIFSL